MAAVPGGCRSPLAPKGRVAACHRLPRCLPALPAVETARCDAGGSAVTPPADGGDARSNLCSNEPNTTPPAAERPPKSRIFARIGELAPRRLPRLGPRVLRRPTRDNHRTLRTLT